MKNKYVDFISDEHLLSCIANLYNSYQRAKQNISKRNFYSNKVDVIKFAFDSKFNGISEENLVQAEVLRQTDKTVNNSIGTFHEQVLGGIAGYEGGYLQGYDIRAVDNTLFADIKNKHNTMNSSSAEALFQKLAHFANTHKGAKCYWVQILAKSSFCEQWFGEINGKEYSHSRVFKISGDRFYALLAKQDNALFHLYQSLPIAIADFLSTVAPDEGAAGNTALNEILADTKLSGRSILDQISFDNYSYYNGFNEL